ncbi:hypothetical protein B0O99DRAFT_685642 [Bisporella sp. PMI_857]|nr:hypothetical protein B0O99DRAFT_685642 [Bisporella sp. PMI_857]
MHQSPASSKVKIETPKPALLKERAIDFSKPQCFVTVIVDKPPKEQKFVVHKALISQKSPFFKRAFEGPF